MTATNATVAPAQPGQDDSKFQIYVQIAMLLAVITGVETVVIFIPFAKWLIVTALVVLSAVKFLFVIFYFMHLRWDKAFCTIVFLIGMVLGGGTLWALIELFSVKDSLPLTSLG
jgi:cytochrome c oxidase subunit 4